MKSCNSCGKAMISNEDYCLSCRSKKKAKYISKSTTFNPDSKRHMEIWSWCLEETEGFKAQNFSDFIREKLEWCMKHEGDVR